MLGDDAMDDILDAWCCCCCGLPGAAEKNRDVVVLGFAVKCHWRGRMLAAADLIKGRTTGARPLPTIALRTKLIERIDMRSVAKEEEKRVKVLSKSQR